MRVFVNGPLHGKSTEFPCVVMAAEDGTVYTTSSWYGAHLWDYVEYLLFIPRGSSPKLYEVLDALLLSVGEDGWKGHEISTEPNNNIGFLPMTHITVERLRWEESQKSVPVYDLYEMKDKMYEKLRKREAHAESFVHRRPHGGQGYRVSKRDFRSSRHN